MKIFLFATDGVFEGLLGLSLYFDCVATAIYEIAAVIKKAMILFEFLFEGTTTSTDRFEI